MVTSHPPHPWSSLPTSLGRLLAPALPPAAQATVAAIQAEVPAYRDAWDDRIGPTVRRGVDLALQRMLELFGTDQAALSPRAARFYRAVGAGEHEQGRSLESLLAAYRTGARVAWEHLSAAALAADVAPRDLAVLAESIFVYIDELSAASAQGHAQADSRSRGYRDVLRSQLASALVDGVAAREPARVRALADSAGWEIPESLAVAVVPKADTGPALPTAPADVLVLEREHDAIAVIPDPAGPGRRRRLMRGITGPVYVGTIRGPEQARLSMTQAINLQGLAVSGVLPDSGVVLAGDHLPELLMAADPETADEIRHRALAPLAVVPEGKREVLIQTLRAWLDAQGDRGAVAKALVVHPQTVSYRLHRLREIFGDRLDSSRGRLLLQLALLGTP